MGHRVTLEARDRGAIVRPLGDTVILMPPLGISEEDLRRLVAITTKAIQVACASAPPASGLAAAA
jgi:adenosylmethionine-8-amino-7-oxononanoate aminotransferase